MEGRLVNGFVSPPMPRIAGLRCCWPLLLLHLLSAAVSAQTQSQSELVGVNQAIQDSAHLNAQGKYIEAIAVTRKAINRAENLMAPAEPALLELRMTLAGDLQAAGEAQQAETQARIVERVARSANNNDLLADALVSLSGITMSDGRIYESLQRAQEALSIARLRRPRDEGRLRTALLQTSIAVQFMGGPSDALPLLVEAEHLLEGKTDDFSRQQHVITLNGLVDAYRGLGDEARLLIALNKLKVAAQTPQEKELYEKRSLAVQYTRAMNTGRFQEALALNNQISAAGLFPGGNIDLRETNGLTQLAWQYTYLGDYVKAHDAYRQAFQRFHKIYVDAFVSRTEAERHQLIAEMAGPLAHFYSFTYLHREDHPEGVREAYDLAGWQRTSGASSLREQQARMAASGSSDVRAAIDALRAKQLDLSARTRSATPDPLIPALEKNIEDAQLALYPRLKDIGLTDGATATRIAAALPSQDACVEILVFMADDELGPTFVRTYFAIVMKPGREHALTMVKLGTAPQIEYNETRLQAQGNLRSSDRNTTIHYSSLPWIALEPTVLGARHVYLAPDGVLDTSPFLAWQGKDGRYLIDRDDLDVRPVFSTGDLVAPAINSGSNTAILLGNADFDSSPTIPSGPPTMTAVSPAATVRSMDFGPVTPLEHTGPEVEAIFATMSRSGWKVPPPLEGATATKTEILRVVHPRVLHIATHGYSVSSSSGGAEMDPMGLEISLESSGLLLAGANRTIRHQSTQEGPDDGVLSAMDVTSMDLHGTELVVLSACDTGLGQQSASGEVLGLRRSFHMAGAQSVMVSMWPVNDAVTDSIMSEFYETWISSHGKIDKYEALKQAARKVKRDPAHLSPVDWAPFVLFASK